MIKIRYVIFQEAGIRNPGRTRRFIHSFKRVERPHYLWQITASLNNHQFSFCEELLKPKSSGVISSVGHSPILRQMSSHIICSRWLSSLSNTSRALLTFRWQVSVHVLYTRWQNTVSQMAAVFQCRYRFLTSEDLHHAFIY